MNAAELAFKCSPLRAWLLEAACARNHELAHTTGDAAARAMLAECVRCAGVRERLRLGLETEQPRPALEISKVTDPDTRDRPPALPRRGIGANVGAQMREVREKRQASIETKKEPEAMATKKSDPPVEYPCAKCSRAFARRAWRDKHEEFCTAGEVGVQTPDAPAAAHDHALDREGGGIVARLVSKRLALLEEVRKIDAALEQISAVAKALL